MPKTLKIKIFTYDELSDAAKETAREWYLGEGFEFHWGDEYRKALEGFTDIFPITVSDWEVDNNNYSFRMRFRELDYHDEITGMSGIRLRTYILNNYYSTLYQRKPYGKYEKRENGKWRYDRYSKVQWIETDCPFTGFCGDADILDPIREFLKNPKNSTTFQRLMDDCINSFFTAWKKDCEWQMSEEYIADHLESNEYEFDEFGNRFTAPYDKKVKKNKRKVA